MATAGVLERNHKRAYFDDTTRLTVSIITNRSVPPKNHVVSVQKLLSSDYNLLCKCQCIYIEV